MIFHFENCTNSTRIVLAQTRFQNILTLDRKVLRNVNSSQRQQSIVVFVFMKNSYILNNNVKQTCNE